MGKRAFPPGADLRFGASLPSFFTCWTDEVVLTLAPSLSQKCFDATADDEAIGARSANQSRARHPAEVTEKPFRPEEILP